MEKIDFEAWLKSNVPYGCLDIKKCELLTIVRVRGLNYLSATMEAFKNSFQRAEMRDMQFKGDRLIIGYANV